MRLEQLLEKAFYQGTNYEFSLDEIFSFDNFLKDNKEEINRLKSSNYGR